MFPVSLDRSEIRAVMFDGLIAPVASSHTSAPRKISMAFEGKRRKESVMGSA
jgi:hypothetical protein